MTTPYPTPARLALARDIASGLVRHYWWTTPTTFWRSDDSVNERRVTAEVREFVRADPPLATWGVETPGGWTFVRLTADGEAWLARGAT